jgi:hypothetical protein
MKKEEKEEKVNELLDINIVQELKDFTIEMVECVEKIEFSLWKKIQEKLHDQHFIHKANLVLHIFIEMYRILTSSLLILFVPQNCDGQICSIEQNMIGNNIFYYVGLGSNFFTLFFFLCLYTIEIIREILLLTYLDVNLAMPNEDEKVEKTLETLSLEKKEKILRIDKYYQIFGYLSIGIFILNIVLSSFIIHHYYLNNQTTSTMLTYVLFMMAKIYSIYNIANTKKNTFYSAYVRINVQYNDLEISLREKSTKSSFHDRSFHDRSLHDRSLHENSFFYVVL